MKPPLGQRSKKLRPPAVADCRAALRRRASAARLRKVELLHSFLENAARPRAKGRDTRLKMTAKRVAKIVVQNEKQQVFALSMAAKTRHFDKKAPLALHLLRTLSRKL